GSASGACDRDHPLRIRPSRVSAPAIGIPVAQLPPSRSAIIQRPQRSCDWWRRFGDRHGWIASRDRRRRAVGQPSTIEVPQYANGKAAFFVATNSASAIGAWPGPAIAFLLQCTDGISLFARVSPPASGEHDAWPLGRMVHTRQGDWAGTTPAWLHAATRRDRRWQSTSSPSWNG